VYQPDFARIQTEDLGDKPPKALDPVVYQINLIVDYLKIAFAKGISFQDNCLPNYRTLQLKSTGVPATDTISFAVSLPNGYQPLGVQILNCIDLSGALVGNPVTCEMTPGLQNGSVVVRAIYGLTADHTYSINFQVF
jgi:hypothetical protein